MNAHTPGPWHFRPLFGRDTFAIFFPDGSMKRRVDDKAGGFNEPDAHLIAAAPDLLEALLAVVSVADRKTAEFDMARAAIAKATGNSS